MCCLYCSTASMSPASFAFSRSNNTCLRYCLCSLANHETPHACLIRSLDKGCLHAGHAGSFTVARMLCRMHDRQNTSWHLGHVNSLRDVLLLIHSQMPHSTCAVCFVQFALDAIVSRSMMPLISELSSQKHETTYDTGSVRL